MLPQVVPALLTALAVLSLAEEAPLFDTPTESTASSLVMTTVEGVNIMLLLGAGEFIEGFMETSIPDVEGEVSTGVGTIDYSLSNIAFTNVDLDAISLETDSEAGAFVISISNVSFGLSFEYAAQLLSWPYTSDEGAATLDVLGSVRASMTFPYDAAAGTMALEVGAIAVALDAFDVWLDGGAISAILDALIAALGDELSEAVAAAVEAALRDFLSYKAQDEFFDTFHCVEGICQDDRLARAPAVADTYISNLYGGTYYAEYLQDLYEAPAAYTALPTAINGRMFQLFFGPACFSTYFAAVFDAGKFEDVCAAAPDAAALCAALPALCAAAPDAAFDLEFSMEAAPTQQIFYSSLEVQLDVLLDVSDAASGAAVALRLAVTAAGDVDFQDCHFSDAPVVNNTGDLSIELAPYDIAAALVRSTVGAVAISDELLTWASDVFFQVAYDGAWRDTLDAERFQTIIINQLVIDDRDIVYDPDYVAVTFDVLSPE